MTRNAPDIDARDLEALVQQFRALIPFYTAEWRPEEGDAGLALVQIFCRMLEHLLHRLNQVPRKQLLSFLNELGLSLLPAQPATVPVAFILAEGTVPHVAISEQTQIAAGDVIFETRNAFLATPSRIKAVYSLDAANDAIVQSPPHLPAGQAAAAFQTRLLHDAASGERTLFLQHSEGLQNDDVIVIGKREYGIVTEVTDSQLTLRHKLARQHRATSLVEKVTSFELFEGRNLQEHELYLAHSDLFHVEGGVELALTCTFVQGGLALLKSCIWEYWGERQIANSEPVSDWYAFDAVRISAGALRLTKTSPDDITEYSVNGIKNRWIRGRVPGSQIARFQTIMIDTIAITAQASTGPDMSFSNDVPLDVTCDDSGDFQTPLYPFGKQPGRFSTFYLGSPDVFSKKNAAISLEVTLDAAEGTSAPSSDLALSWEYWNGQGWTGIPSVFSYDFSSSGTVQFSCPADIEPTAVNGQKNFWIRIRIVHGDYGRVQFVEATVYQITPTVLKNLQEEDVAKQTLEKLASLQTQPAIDQKRFIASLHKLLDDSEIKAYLALILRHALQTLVRADTSQIFPPKIKRLRLAYLPSGQPVQSCLTRNNLDFEDHTEESRTAKQGFQPFRGLPDASQSLYLGFDQKLEKGPVSIFWDIEEQAWTGDVPPRIIWEYYTGNGTWTRLDALDTTDGLLKSGTIQYVFPLDFQRGQFFGQDLYWIRAVETTNAFTPIKRAYAELFPSLSVDALSWLSPVLDTYLIPGFALYKPAMPFETAQPFRVFQKAESPMRFRGGQASESSSQKPSCEDLLSFSHPAWQHPAAITRQTLSPKIRGIYLNTVWAIQTESIRNEVLGASNGTAEQTFSFLKTPVVTETIWVNEWKTLTEQEKSVLQQQGSTNIREVKDAQGNVTEFWVQWTAVTDFVASSGDARHYTIDNAVGKIVFGDGVYGRIPPVGTNNILADYQVGGGTQGNLAVDEVKDLKSSIPFVEKARNPLPAAGGTAVEAVEEALERGTRLLKHRNRPVTCEDFEILARQVSRDIARVKCLPLLDTRGNFAPGWVTLLLVPGSQEKRPKLSVQVKQRVESFIRASAANTLVEGSHFQVLEPLYVEVSVNTTVIAMSPAMLPLVEKTALTGLETFLHPLFGGNQGTGWEFGRLPCFSDLYGFLEKIDGVDHVTKLGLTLRTYDDYEILSEVKLSPETQRSVQLPPYALMYSGAHTVTVRVNLAT